MTVKPTRDYRWFMANRLEVRSGGAALCCGTETEQGTRLVLLY